MAGSVVRPRNGGRIGSSRSWSYGPVLRLWDIWSGRTDGRNGASIDEDGCTKYLRGHVHTHLENDHRLRIAFERTIQEQIRQLYVLREQLHVAQDRVETLQAELHAIPEPDLTARRGAESVIGVTDEAVAKRRAREHAGRLAPLRAQLREAQARNAELLEQQADLVAVVRHHFDAALGDSQRWFELTARRMTRYGRAFEAADDSAAADLATEPPRPGWWGDEPWGIGAPASSRPGVASVVDLDGVRARHDEDDPRGRTENAG